MTATGPTALTPSHRRMLEVDSAILPEVLAEEDIGSRASSLGLPTPDAALRHRNSHKGQHFGTWGETDGQHRPIDLGPGIWFGTRDAHGRLSGQYRPDRPRTAYSGHTVKYETCRGTRPSFAIPKRCLDALLRSKDDVYITEGYRKALALASAGACAVSLAGVDAWSVRPEPDAPGEPIEDFDAVPWRGRVVLPTFDSDIREKDGVRWAERRLTRELERRGAIVIPLRIPHGPDGSKRGIDDYLRDRLAAGVSRADALSELKAVALAELVRLSRLRRGPSTDDEQGCQECPRLREQLQEYQAADELVLRGPFTPDGAQVVKHLVTVARAGRHNGKEKVPLERKEVARLALGADGTAAEKAVSRGLAAYKQLQDDPERLKTLPFRLEWREGGRKTHIDLYPLTPETPRTKAEEYRALARVPRPATEPKPIRDRDDGCPRCHGAEGVESRSTKRCLNDACGHTWHTRPVILGRTEPAPAETPTPPTLPLVDTLPGQNVPAKDVGTYAGHFVPANATPPAALIPAPTYSREDYVAAAGPRRWGDAPPEDPAPPPEPKPLPLAPPHHRAWTFKPPPPAAPPAVAGGEA